MTLVTAALADPPERVGRVAYLEGGVSLRPPQQDDWVWASRNYPAAPGEALWTGEDGRAEVQVGAVELRLDRRTALDVLDLDYGGMRVGLTQGALDVRVWAVPTGGVTVSTPVGDVRLQAAGLYRIDVDQPAGEGVDPGIAVTVFDGQAETSNDDGVTPVRAGEAAVLYPGASPRHYAARNAAIDDWGRRREAEGAGPPPVSDDEALPGMEDLYASGNFTTDPDYGQVWYPREVPSDWVPYSDGQWVWVAPWGYTWVDNQPWGFTPFHYGRWARIHDRWGWIPGERRRQPVYAPALVGFFGGGGWRVRGSEAVGWAPLGPGEAYRPGYEAGDDYRRRLNADGRRDGHRDDRPGENRDGRGLRNGFAATVVGAAAFSGGQPVRRSAIPVTPDVVAGAPTANPMQRPPGVRAFPPGSADQSRPGQGASARDGGVQWDRGSRQTPPTGSIAGPPANGSRPNGPGFGAPPSANGPGAPPPFRRPADAAASSPGLPRVGAPEIRRRPYGYGQPGYTPPTPSTSGLRASPPAAGTPQGGGRRHPAAVSLWPAGGRASARDPGRETAASAPAGPNVGRACGAVRPGRRHSVARPGPGARRSRSRPSGAGPRCADSGLCAGPEGGRSGASEPDASEPEPARGSAAGPAAIRRANASAGRRAAASDFCAAVAARGARLPAAASAGAGGQAPGRTALSSRAVPASRIV